ncbi:MAG: hypothetical protein HYR62_05830 [Actinobacteria bacterium]|nr:hypothetical protein [Actinomycetota bacterium]MBI3687947.1 hypothetical protein [Actinomycetota bacterium]
MPTTPELVLDPRLLPAWRAALGPGTALPRGLAGAAAGDRAAVVVVTTEPPGERALAAAAAGFSAALGVAAVEVCVASGASLAGLIREWVHQAAQGSGRGVRVRVRAEATGVQVLVDAIDSSARELVLRLASPHEPALPALRALLGGVRVAVQDAEEPPPEQGLPEPRILELRVHGVSNPPPPNILDSHGAPIRLVAGDSDTGFWRLADPPPGPVVTEAYSWGQLTSGRRTGRNDLRRALWMVLLPLSLANVAFWARPRLPADPRRDRPWPPSADGLAGYLVRLVCLSLTGTLALAATGITADLVAWQCDGGCPSRVPGLGFLGHDWWSVGTRPLSVGLLGPVAVLVGLWLLSRRTYQYEAVTAHTAGRGGPVTAVTQMDSPDFWRGEGQIHRLAALHLAFGGGAASLAVLGAILVLDGRAGAAPWLAGLTLGPLLGLAVLLPVAMLAMPAVVRRGTGGRHWTVLPLGCAVAGLLGTAGYAVLADPAGIPASHRSLPLYGGMVSWLFATQFLLVLAIAGLTRWRWRGLLPTGVGVAAVLCARYPWLVGVDLSTRGRFVVVLTGLVLAGGLVVLPGRPAAGTGPAAVRARLSQPAWHGEAAALLTGLGWLVAVFYSAAVLFRVADYLNGAEPPTSGRTVLVPTPLTWNATGLTVTLAAPLAAVWLAWRWTRRTRRRLVTDWDRAHPRAGAHERRRFVDVATARAMHSFAEERGLAMVGWLAVPVLVVLAAGVAGGFSTVTPAELFGAPGRPDPVLAWLSDTGATLVALVFTGLVGTGFLAYRNDTARRTIGIVWDLSTFWPRAAHPFGPPCYAERVVPQLVTRICNLPPASGGAGIILAGHSQGSTIATATVRQLPDGDRARVFLLTFGTQLNRLYGRVFPAFFGPAALRDLAERLRPAGGTEPRWRSLHRATDPLGYPVDVRIDGWAVEPVDAAGNAIPLPDPTGLAPSDGQVLDPPIRGHSDYPAAPEYQTVRDAAAARLLS